MPDSGDQKRRIAIIGSGFSGLCLAIQLKKAGIESFTVFEKSACLGGTWRDNTYPGARAGSLLHVPGDGRRRVQGQAAALGLGSAARAATRPNAAAPVA